MARAIQVFVSSTFVGMEQFRQAVLEALHGVRFIKPTGMEYFGATDTPSIEKCLREVRECDMFVAILGPRYGSIVQGANKSYSEVEWDEAIGLGKPTYLFCSTALGQQAPIESDEIRRKQEDFRSRASLARQAAYFGSPDELAKKVLLAILNRYSTSFLVPTSNEIPTDDPLVSLTTETPVETSPTYLLFPYVTAAGGYDTGIAVMNTSQEPFGKGVTGAARVYFSASRTLPERLRDKDPERTGIPIGVIYPGDYRAWQLSTGGVGDLEGAVGYTGQLWLKCNFRPCAGVAFITNRGETRWSSFYKAEVIEP